MKEKSSSREKPLFEVIENRYQKEVILPEIEHR